MPATFDKAPLPNRLKELRDERGLTIAGFARTIGVSRETLRRWESGGEMPDYRKRQIAALLEVTVGQLLGCRRDDCDLKGCS